MAGRTPRRLLLLHGWRVRSIKSVQRRLGIKLERESDGSSTFLLEQSDLLHEHLFVQTASKDSTVRKYSNSMDPGSIPFDISPKLPPKALEGLSPCAASQAGP